MSTGVVVDLADLEARITAAATGRLLVAGAGKWTLAEQLVDRLNAADPGTAAILPVDGYHYDDGLLIARGQRPVRVRRTPSTWRGSGTCRSACRSTTRAKSPFRCSIATWRVPGRARE